MKRQENQGHFLGLHMDFPMQISDSTAMANNTAGLVAVSQRGEKQAHGG